MKCSNSQNESVAEPEKDAENWFRAMHLITNNNGQHNLFQVVRHSCTYIPPKIIFTGSYHLSGLIFHPDGDVAKIKKKIRSLPWLSLVASVVISFCSALSCYEYFISSVWGNHNKAAVFLRSVHLYLYISGVWEGMLEGRKHTHHITVSVGLYS